MAQKVSIQLVDDIDGSDAVETVAFALDGTTYEIDLAEKNVKAFRKAITPYVEKARKVSGRNRPTTRATVSTPRSGPDPKLVRQWAKDNGLEVNDIGRVPASVVKQYEEAQSA